MSRSIPGRRQLSLQRHHLNMQALPSLELHVAESLALFEKAVPRSQQVIQIHVMGHLVRQIQLFGPLLWHSIYPLEFFFRESQAQCKVQKDSRGCNPTALQS